MFGVEAFLRSADVVYALRAEGTTTVGRSDECDIVRDGDADEPRCVCVVTDCAQYLIATGVQWGALRVPSACLLSHHWPRPGTARSVLAARLQRRHALTACATQVVLHDLNSHNGCFVNGTRLHNAAKEVFEGDTVRFGYDSRYFRCALCACRNVRLLGLTLRIMACTLMQGGVFRP